MEFVYRQTHINTGLPNKNIYINKLNEELFHIRRRRKCKCKHNNNNNQRIQIIWIILLDSNS